MIIIVDELMNFKVAADINRIEETGSHWCQPVT
jgi:hypothetical protein